MDGSLASLLAPVLPQIASIHTVVVTGEVDLAPLRRDGVSVVGYEDFIAGHPETFDWPENSKYFLTINVPSLHTNDTRRCVVDRV